jgi:DNA-binding IclR family transcriptional regulator
MECLARKLKATVHLATLDGTDVVYLDKVRAEGGPRIAVSGVGRRLPLHCTAVGKALLAHQSPGTISHTLDRLSMEPVTDRTISSVDTLRFELASSRRSGIARDREGSVLGVCCHAAPITEAGRVTAAISLSVSMAIERQLGERYDEIVRAAAVKISHRLATAPTELPRRQRVAV